MSISQVKGVTSVSQTDLLYSVSNNRDYFFHGYAVNQISGDAGFYDISGNLNIGTRGANLSNAQLFATAGYLSTIDPAGGSTDSVIRFSNLNFDYNGGEKFIFWWLGTCTAEAGNSAFAGDGINGTYHGMKIRANSTGTLQMALYDNVQTTGLFSGTTSGTPFNGSLNSIGIVLDGQNKKYAFWVNDVLDSNFSSGYATYGAGAAVDTRNSNTFNLGTSAPAAALSTDGIVVSTRAMAIFRMSSTETVPPEATITTIFKQLRANPGKILTNSAF